MIGKEGKKITNHEKHQIIRDDVKIGENTKIWHHVNLYGCEIGTNCTIASHAEIGNGVKIGNYCKIEAYAFIPSGVTVEDYVLARARLPLLSISF